MTLKKVVYAICALALLFGVWGVYDRLVHGHQNAAYGSYVVWGLWVAAYFFFVGTAAGALMVASLDLLFRMDVFRGTGRTALWIALVSLAGGLLSIWLDLGHMDRIWKVYLQGNLVSVLAQLVWGYTVFGALVLVALYLAIRKPDGPVLRGVMLVGLGLSFFLSGAVGAALGVQGAREFWHVGLFPVQFPVFTMASGAAAVLAALGLFGARNDPRRPQQLQYLATATIVLSVIKLYFLWADFSQSLYAGVPHNVKAVNEVLFGQYWWSFWILQILIGTLIPIVVLVQPRLARDGLWAGWMGALVLMGFGVARMNILLPALVVPELDALMTAFSGPHLSFDYFPSPMEWAVTAGITGLVVAAFLIGSELLPLRVQESR